MTAVSRDVLDDLRAKADAATAGPWEAEPDTNAGRVWVQLGRKGDLDPNCFPAVERNSAREPMMANDAKRCVRCGGREVALIEEWLMSKVHPPETYSRNESGQYVIPDDYSAHPGNADATGRWFFDCWSCGHVWTARGINIHFAERDDDE